MAHQNRDKPRIHKVLIEEVTDCPTKKFIRWCENSLPYKMSQIRIN